MPDTAAIRGSFFDLERSAALVADRAGPKANPRLAEVIAILARHIHAAVREAAITPEEWFAGIRFLTETGQICSDVRQEFILLSDVMGVSMLVDAINVDRPDGATENTVLGPFHVSGAPRYEAGADIRLDGKGEATLVSGRVLDIERRPIAGANLDVWQANSDGFYDVQARGEIPEWNLRGQFTTDAEGRYSFITAKPLHYPIPTDGTVGDLIARLDRSPVRPAHLHFIVDAPGFDRVVTHIFVPDCPHLGSDPVFGVKESLVADFRRDDADGAARWRVDWDFTLTETRA